MLYIHPSPAEFDFPSTSQSHSHFNSQRDISPPVSCTSTASPHSETGSMDYLHQVDEPGNWISIYPSETSFPIERGPQHYSNTGADNVFGDLLSFYDPWMYDPCNYFPGEVPQGTTHERLYDDYGQASPMNDNISQAVSYPVFSEPVPATHDLGLVPENHAFDPCYQHHSFFVSTGIQQRPVNPRQQKLRAVGSPAITMAARNRRERGAAYQCAHCGSTFTALHNLKNHLDAHEGLKRHKCHKCGRCFVTKHVLTRHAKTLCK